VFHRLRVEMNSEEGARALSQAKRALSVGNISEAIKFLKISHRLSPCPETAVLLAQHSPSPDTSRNPSPNPQDHLTVLRNLLEKTIERILRLEEKYIEPSMKQFIRGMFLLIIVLFVLKYIFRQPIGIGMLPGDIYYASSNVSVSAPFVSCFLVSFVLNGLVRAFHS
jgi:hypothetical protein